MRARAPPPTPAATRTPLLAACSQPPAIRPAPPLYHLTQPPAAAVLGLDRIEAPSRERCRALMRRAAEAAAAWSRELERTAPARA